MKKIFRHQLLLSLFLFTSVLLNTSDCRARQTENTISSITIKGNEKTRSSFILKLTGLDTGIVYDSAIVSEAENILLSTNLFVSAAVLPQFKADGIEIVIFLVEKKYFRINSIGGVFYNYRYGEPTDRWWLNVYGGAEYSNFRGKMERISLSLSFPGRYSLGLSWYKPFVPLPYFIKTGIGISYYPSIYIHYDNFSFYQYTTLGRKVGKGSRVYTSLAPMIGSKKWKGGKGILTETSIDKKAPLSANPFDNSDKTYNSSWKDTVAENEKIIEREWTGYNRSYIKENEKPYNQLYVMTGFINDFRESDYDISGGIYNSIRVKTNSLCPRKEEYSYMEINTDTRFYHQGFFNKHKAAYRLKTTFRLDSSDIHDNLYCGGEYSLRGYPLGYFPRGFIANNKVIFTSEYRFPLFKTPEITYPVLSQYHDGLREFYYRMDMAVFFDAGVIWHYLKNLDSHNKRQAGTDAGIGLRAMAPTLKHSICLDAAWSIREWGTNSHHEYYRLKKSAYSSKRWKAAMPEIYLYLDMHY